MDIRIKEEVKRACPDLRLGILKADVIVHSSTQDFWSRFESMLTTKAGMSFESIREIKTIAASREGYKALGADPSRYRLSAEALHRRLTKGRGLYKVNNVVDIINIISIQSGFSIGGYNRNKILKAVSLSKGKAGEPYPAIGRGDLNIENLPVLYDSNEPFGSPTSDSERTKITGNTNEIVLVFFDFNKDELLNEAIESSCRLLVDYAHSIKQEISIIL